MSAGNHWSEERLARAALTHVCEAGSPELVRQIALHGPRRVWQSLQEGPEEGTWPRRARALQLDEMLSLAEQNGVRFVIPGDDEWPEQLEVLERAEVAGMGGPPMGLWLRGPGSLAGWSQRSVALVGSRASTPYGDAVATDLAIDLAGDPDQPWTVVSGGAYGIDAAAHRGALAAHGRTIAVLAGGLDEPYPRGNAQLFETLAAEQLLVSEVPCGMHPTRVGFLARNRLIAALALGTVVVEAGARSGANNTASWAGECGRVVMAVPGPVHSAQSVTPHRLVRDHRAELVCHRDDVLALVGDLDRAPLLPIGGGPRPLDAVEPELLAVREVLPGRGAMPTGEVARRAGLSLPQARASLGRLEQMALVRADETGQWRICRPSATAGRRGQ